MHQSWAIEEFGHADLGSRRRTARLVNIATQVATLPGGRITEVFHNAAEREAAFRFVENDAVLSSSLGEASHIACARRSTEYPYVFIPIDGSSLNITDWERAKGLGIVGARYVGATGLLVMSAIGVAPTGVPLGMCGQEYWVRRGRAHRRKCDKRKPASKESIYWLTVMAHVVAVYAKYAPITMPWFQIDRGGDAWIVLDYIDTHGVLATVRAEHNRRLWLTSKKRTYLRSTMRRAPVCAIKHITVPPTSVRSGRTARLEIRFAKVTIDLRNVGEHRGRPGDFNAVLVRESGTVPHGEKPIEWLLLTTHSVEDALDAELVVDGYATRWTIEDFHRAWKSGVCHVEETQLRSCDHIVRWATILASVAIRAVRLAKLARSEPNIPATSEFTSAEIKAALFTMRREPSGKYATLGEIIKCIAEIGGYIGKSSGGPPGATTIARGLDRIQLLARYLSDEETKK